MRILKTFAGPPRLTSVIKSLSLASAHRYLAAVSGLV